MKDMWKRCTKTFRGDLGRLCRVYSHVEGQFTCGTYSCVERTFTHGMYTDGSPDAYKCVTSKNNICSHAQMKKLRQKYVCINSVLGSQI